MSRPHTLDRLGVIAWRLGLGWLVGRRFLLLTTTAGDGERRSLLPYVFAAGDVYLMAEDGTAPWLEDLARAPRATIQAGPGWKGMLGRRLTDRGEIGAAEALHCAHPRARHRLRRLRTGGGDPVFVILEPTGQITPALTAPDLVWLWAALLIPRAASSIRLRARRGMAGRPPST